MPKCCACSKPLDTRVQYHIRVSERLYCSHGCFKDEQQAEFQLAERSTDDLFRLLRPPNVMETAQT